MPRRNQPPKRQVGPDLKYNSEVVHRLINRVMHSGKKATAMRVVYDMMATVEERASLQGGEAVGHVSGPGGGSPRIGHAIAACHLYPSRCGSAGTGFLHAFSIGAGRSDPFRSHHSEPLPVG